MNNIEEIFNNKQELLFKEIAKTTILFLMVENTQNPKALATGVLVRINTDHYIWTAAHVIDENISNIAISIGDNNVIYPGGKWIYNKCDNRSKDDIDVAILKLNLETVKTLSNYYTFLDQDKILLNHKVEELPLYSINGFPAKKNTKKYNEDKIDLNIFCHSTSGITNPDEYRNLNVDLNKSILVNYNKIQYESILKLKHNSIALNGMSGCGLWYYKFTPSGALDYFLVGIFNERNLKNKQRLISTRNEIYIYATKIKFNKK